MPRISSRITEAGDLSMHAILRRFGVCRQTFAGSKLNGDGAKLARTLARNLDQARALLEVVHTERRGEAGGAGSGQHVVRTSAIIAQRFGRITPEKNGTRVSDTSSPAFGILD